MVGGGLWLDTGSLHSAGRASLRTHGILHQLHRLGLVDSLFFLCRHVSSVPGVLEWAPVDKHVGALTLSNAKGRNVLGLSVIRLLKEAVDELSGSGVKVVLLKAKGPVFSAGEEPDRQTERETRERERDQRERDMFTQSVFRSLSIELEWCSGHNLKELEASSTEEKHVIFSEFGEVCKALVAAPFTSIAVVSDQIAAAAGCQVRNHQGENVDLNKERETRERQERDKR